MKIYLVWNHDEIYLFPFIEKIFIDGLAAGKYVREGNEGLERNKYFLEEREAE